MMVTLKDVFYRLQEIADDAFHHGEVDPDEIQELINSVGKTITRPASEDEKRVEAFELWQRLFEESDSPFYASEAGGDIYCFFCGEWQPNYPHEQTHETDCIYLAAKNLVKDDVTQLDANGQPIPQRHIAVIDDEYKVYSTRTHTRHEVEMASQRSIRRRRDRYEKKQQIGALLNWGLVLAMLGCIALYAVTWAVIS